MRTIAEIEVTPMGTLYVDVLRDPPALDIRRGGGGLVHIDAGELQPLIDVLIQAGVELAVLASEDVEDEQVSTG